MGFKGGTSSKSRVTNNNLRTQGSGGYPNLPPWTFFDVFFLPLPLPFGTWLTQFSIPNHKTSDSIGDPAESEE